MEKKRVLVGMSGGIDSTAACLMLQEQGYEVIGLTLRTWDLSRQFSDANQELPDYVIEAQTLAERLGMEHHLADVRAEFRQQIVSYFIEEYMKGRTPNPCVMCNPLFKFRLLAEWADRLGCTYIATGHYSCIERKNGLCYITTGNDPQKDQSYFLWRLGQAILNRCLFPLGGLTKTEVRAYLRERGFDAKASGSESMEVCFIDGDYRNFLHQQVPDLDERVGEGWFVNAAGVKLGKHKGYPYYTVGQRKGLEIALGHPAYVLKTNPEKNTVILGEASELQTEYMLLEDECLVHPSEIFTIPDICVRIRYRSKPIPCTLRRLEDGRLLVRFLEVATGIAPGQSAVFYQGNRLLGGAFIASQRGIGMYIEQTEASKI